MENRQNLYLIVEQIITELSQIYPLKMLNSYKEYFADQCDIMRMTLIREYFNSYKYVEQSFYQELPCDDSMITCHSVECTINGVTFETDTDIWEIEIPNLVSGVGPLNIKSITDKKKTFVFTRVGYEDFIDYETEYTRPGPIFTNIGEKLYLKNLPTDGMSFVSIWALLSSPRGACGWKDTNYYPVPSVYKLKLLVKKDFLSTRPDQRQEPQKKEADDRNQET